MRCANWVVPGSAAWVAWVVRVGTGESGSKVRLLQMVGGDRVSWLAAREGRRINMEPVGQGEGVIACLFVPGWAGGQPRRGVA